MRSLDAIVFTEQAAPSTPAAGTVAEYASSSDHAVHSKDSTGTDTALGAGSGSAPTVGQMMAVGL